MGTPERIVIVGATSAIAEQCARLWVEGAGAPGVDLVLVGRDAGRLERVAADLRVRSPASRVQVCAADLVDPPAITQAVGRIVAEGCPQQVLIAQGWLPERAQCERDLELLAAALRVNAVSPVLWAQAFSGPMQQAGRGCIALIGSVAGDRGRRSNYVYGSAKALVDAFAQGLRHRLFASGVTVVLVKPGPTATPMTAHLAAAGRRLADPRAVARRIVQGMRRGTPVVYAPAHWRLIMAVIRRLPGFIFHRLDL